MKISIYIHFCPHGMGFLPREQCRKAPASAAEKGHILELLIKPQRLPCFKSKLYLGYKKE